MTHDEKMEALELDAARNLVLLPDVRKERVRKIQEHKRKADER